MRMAATEEKGHGAHPAALVLLVLSLLDEGLGKPTQTMSAWFRQKMAQKRRTAIGTTKECYDML